MNSQWFQPSLANSFSVWCPALKSDGSKDGDYCSQVKALVCQTLWGSWQQLVWELACEDMFLLQCRECRDRYRNLNGIWRFTLQKQNHKQPNSFSSSISRFLATTAVKRLAGEDDADANQDGDGLSPHHWGTYNKWMGSKWAWWICMLKCVPWFCWSRTWLKFRNRMKLIWLVGNVHMMWYNMYRHIIIYT